MRRALRAAAAAAVLAGGLAVVRPPAGADEAPPPVLLRGAGSGDVDRQFGRWHDDLYGDAGALDLGYASVGDVEGRKALIDGTADYAVSGEPFTKAELARLPHGADDLIDAPIMPAAVALALIPFTNAYNSFRVRETVCDANDPNNDGRDCTYDHDYDGPVQVPNRNLAAMIFNYTQQDPNCQTTTDTVSCQPNKWNYPGITSAWDLAKYQQHQQDPADANGNPLPPPYVTTSTPPVSFVRSDGSSTDYYLQQFTKTAAPDVWQGLQKTSPGAVFEPIAETLPRIAVQSRQYLDGVVGSLEALGAPAFEGGLLAAVPPGGFDEVRADKPGLHPALVELKNGAGEWVEPTPASITAAVEAGGDAPLFALTNKVSGAYPLAYVDHLYAPAHGLPLEKTEALATAIRYLVAAAQDGLATSGDGRLPRSMVGQALAAANQLVLSNCTGDGMKVESNSDPGPYAPASARAAMKAAGPMLHCVRAAVEVAAAVLDAPAAAPAVQAAAPVEPGAGAPMRALAAAPVASAAAPAPSVATPAATPAGGSLGPAALVVSRLPMPRPSSGDDGFDRLTALVAGAVLLLALRRPARWAVGVLRP